MLDNLHIQNDIEVLGAHGLVQRADTVVNVKSLLASMVLCNGDVLGRRIDGYDLCATLGNGFCKKPSAASENR